VFVALITYHAKRSCYILYRCVDGPSVPYDFYCMKNSDKCYHKSILHNEELNDLYSSPNIVRVIKSRRVRWAGHVACVGEERGV